MRSTSSDGEVFAAMARRRGTTGSVWYALTALERINPPTKAKTKPETKEKK
jgi:hypothetical protein